MAAVSEHVAVIRATPRPFIISNFDNVLREVREQIQPAPHALALISTRRGDGKKLAKHALVRQCADCL
jgi:hypothetical protein